ncbi:hypothetical protein [Parvularcula marina]|uniref:hypothetical protein n=1 Tax=Parvularcula marina TaxID=2292771 RepID=UPI0035117928
MTDTKPQANRSEITFDFERYAEHLADLDLTDDQAREMLAIMWDIMVQFVDLGFGVHPVQQSCGQADETSPPRPEANSGMVSCERETSKQSSSVDLTSYLLREDIEPTRKGGRR